MKRRNSRKLTKRFELWQTSDDDDDQINESTLISSSWCEIKTFNASSRQFRSTDFGITSTTNSIVIRTRKRNDLTYNSVNQFIKYRGESYTIVTEPYEVEFDNMFIEFVATKLPKKNISTITPINGGNGNGNANGNGNG